MTDHNFEPRHKEMGHHIASGIFNSGVIQLVKILGQVVSVIVLSRLLSPSDFGLIAMTGPVYGFVILILDLGFTSATVQKETLNHEEANTIFWINMVMGAALTLILIVLSPLVGWYYHEPRVVPLTIAMAFLILLGATGNQHTAILTRRMEFGVLALINVAGTVSALAVSILWALVYGGYWSLYAGMAAGSIIPVICIWFASGWRPSTPRMTPSVHSMFKFGANLTIGSLAGFFATNMDNILIGRRWGDYDLGLYDRAYKLLLFPIQRIVGPVTSTMIPVLSRLTTEPERYRDIFLKTIAQLTLAAWPGIIWALVLDDTLVPFLLGKQWAGTASIFEPLAIAGLLQVLNSSYGCLLISQGRSGELARWATVNAVTCIAAFVIGLPYGPKGVAIAYAISECLRTPFLWWYVTRRGPVKLKAMLLTVFPQAVSNIGAALALMVYAKWVEAERIILLVGGLVLSYAITAIIMSLFSQGRETLRQTAVAGKRVLRHALPRT